MYEEQTRYKNMRDLSSDSLITIVVTRMIVRLDKEHVRIEQYAIGDWTMKKMQFDICLWLLERTVGYIGLT